MTSRPRIPDWVWLLGGSLLTTWMAFASVVPSLRLSALNDAPILYSRDAVTAAATVQQMLEGSPLSSDRFGYPFGADWSDWPSLDWGSLAIVKAFTSVSDSYSLIFNLYFLLGVALAFASAYLVLRRFELTPAFAFCGATAFALASYHFERLSLHGHLFLTMYWVAPVYFLLTWRLIDPAPQRPRRQRALAFVGIAALSTFGVYYTAFGLITLTAGLVYALTRRPARAVLAQYLGAAVALFLGVAAQTTPTVLTHLRLGANALAIERSPLDSATYALWPVQLLLPHVTHRLQALADKSVEFYSVALPGNESVMSSVGVIAALGLLVLLLLMFTALAGKELDLRVRFLMAICAVLTAFATVGGLGMLLSLFGFTEIRSWNRLSIFLEFAGILATLVALEPTAQRYSPRLRRLLTPLVLVFVLGAVWLDQTPAPRAETLTKAMAQRQITAGFVHELEQRLPSGAAIYQLPFTGFPEGWRLRTYDAYEFMKPYLESKTLRFNLGGMKGRDGDRFYRALAQRSMETQVSVARTLGFSGIYVDRMGLVDYGTHDIAELERLLGADAATWRDDRRVVYFDLHNDRAALAPGTLSPAQASAVTGFEPSFPKRHRGD